MGISFPSTGNRVQRTQKYFFFGVSKPDDLLKGDSLNLREIFISKIFNPKFTN